MAGAKWLLPFIFPNITLIFKPTNPSDINRVFETAQLFTFFFIRKYLFTCTLQGGIKMDCPPVHIRIGRQNCRPILVSKPSAKE